MLHSPLLIPPGPGFWPAVAQALCDERSFPQTSGSMSDMSALRVLVPGAAHIQPLRGALIDLKPACFLPPRITTLSSWLALRAPHGASSTDSARMMALYAELRQHGWLKKLFSARRNTDLLPLAQTLIALFDELSIALLPQMQTSSDAAQARWEAALAQLSPPARNLLSDEAQLVWTLWKSQLDAADPTAQRLAALQALAQSADVPLVWVGVHEPDAMIQEFLQAYGWRQPVLPIMPDWQAAAPVFVAAWPEIVEGDARPAEAVLPCDLKIYRADSLEDEACTAAQTVIDWLRDGCASIAVIAQDRVVARRMRALLERAQVFVADETGWKLSTTRSAAALVALLEVIATRGETVALLDLLKSPFVFPGDPQRGERVIEIEHALRRENVLGGWENLLGAARAHPEAHVMLKTVADQAVVLAGRKTLAQWAQTTARVLDTLGMRTGLEEDHAGRQVTVLLDLLAHDEDDPAQEFSLGEWRAFLSLQLESTPFVPLVADRRVVMLQLAGAPLRHFDAVLMVGADADHLPSKPSEALFFASAVRRELGLSTREMRQRSQLREFAELLCANPRVVLSWQAQRNGEPNAPSPWLQRLELALAQAGAPPLTAHGCRFGRRTLQLALPVKPTPAASHLLPTALSASGWNSLVACPYQFFALRMLRIDGLDELSDMPEKRDYGEWLHAILKTFHETIRDARTPAAERPALLTAISEQVFGQALQRSGAALAWYARWQKVMPAYLAWAGEREAQGWRFARGEQWLETRVEWDGGEIRLHGRIDRIDESDDGEQAVLDYKTTSLTVLRARLKEGEDHQLAFYGLLAGRDTRHAHYVALDAGKAGDVAAVDYVDWQDRLRERLRASLSEIAKGAPLPAAGIEKVCTYCEVRGLCRKGGWQ